MGPQGFTQEVGSDSSSFVVALNFQKLVDGALQCTLLESQSPADIVWPESFDIEDVSFPSPSIKEAGALPNLQEVLLQKPAAARSAYMPGNLL